MLEAPAVQPVHAEWINLEAAFPTFELAEMLMRLGREGTVFMWAAHKNATLRRTLEQMALRGSLGRSRPHSCKPGLRFLVW